MTAITHSALEPLVNESGNGAILAVDEVTRPMLLSALGDHAAAWIEQTARFFVGMGLAWLLLKLLDWPGLEFLAASSAGVALLYIGNLADVERYRDAILYSVPTLFIWAVLALDSNSAILVGLSYFTHVFLAFFGSFARTSGSLKDLRLWSMLLGFNLAGSIYLISSYLV